MGSRASHVSAQLMAGGRNVEPSLSAFFFSPLATSHYSESRPNHALTDVVTIRLTMRQESSGKM